MPAEFTINLQDLAKVALGTPELTNVQIGVLQSLIEILLKKLNCENETVSVNSFEAHHLENILKTAKTSPMAFNDEHVEKIAEKLERLTKLEENVKEMSDKLELHLKEVQEKDNFDETVITWKNWPNYDIEHLCSTCDPEHSIACRLLKNTDFIKKLLRRISAPTVERLFYFEDKVEELNKAFTDFIKRAEEEYVKIHLLEKCMNEIEGLRKTAKEQKTQFLHAMEEIQDMLDAKLDKIHIPALKKYIKDNFNNIDQSINTLKIKRTCPRAAGIIMEGVRCVSCGNKKVCTDVSAQPATMLPDMPTKSAMPRKKCGDPCGPKKIRNPAISWNLGDGVIIPPKPKVKRVEESTAPKCREAGEDFDLLQGFDGNLYRKG